MKKPQMNGQVTATSNTERMGQTSRERAFLHLQIAYRGLQTNPKSQLLKANRSKMGG